MASASYQPSLIDVLPLGVWHFAGMLDRAAQEELRASVRGVAQAAPLLVPRMPGGVDFRLRSTNAGDYGWTADGTGFYYARLQASGRPWPEIPALALALARKAAQGAGFSDYEPNACLVNYYESGKGSLGLHRDDTRGEDFAAPVVSISLGETCLFAVRGNEKTDPETKIELRSGDALVLGPPGRLYYHQVKSVGDGTSDLLQRGGRVSLTFRRVSFNRP